MRRVTLVVNRFDEGSETFLHSLAQELVELGYEVTVHALRDRGTPMATGQRLDATDGVARSSALPSVRSRRFVPAAAGTVRRESALVTSATRRAVARFGRGARALKAVNAAVPLLATRPDVVYLAFSGIGVALLDALALLEDETSVVVSCRGSGELVAPRLDPSLRPRLRELFLRADAVHAVADVVAAAAVELGAAPDKVRVIRPAIDVERFTRSRPRAPRPGPAQVVTVARLHWIKGIELQLEAAAALRRRGRDVRWTIVGDGPERERLELRSRWMGTEDVVEFVGARHPDEVRELLELADVFVLSSWSEGTANSVLEALALEVPVVSTTAGGMPEVLTDGVDAMLVPLGDAGSLASAVERVVDGPEMASRLAAAGRRTVSGGHTLDLQRSAWGELFDGLGGRRGTLGEGPA